MAAGLACLLCAGAAGATPFAPPQALFPSSPVWSIAVGDVTGDGRDDLLMLPQSGGPGPDHPLRIAVQNANGTLAAPVEIRFGDQSLLFARMFLADLDGDGLQDVVVSGAGALYLLRNEGGLAFTTVRHIGFGGPGDMVFDDVDGDGALDLIAVRSTDFVLARGNGDGTLAGHVTFGAGGYRIALADVDGDGLDDIVAPRDQSIQILPRLAGGGFGDARTFDNPFRGQGTPPVFADFDGDGRVDYAVAQDAFVERPVIAVFSQRADGRFRLAQTMTTTESPGNLRALDVDGDGDLDLVVPHAFRNVVETFPWTGTRFGPPWRNPGQVQNFPETIAYGDIDGDGRVDFLSASSGVQLLRGTTVAQPRVAVAASLALTAAGARVTLRNGGDLPSAAGLSLAVRLHARRGPLDVASLPPVCNRSDGANGGVSVQCSVPAIAPGATREFVVPFAELDRTSANFVFATATASGGGDDSPHDNTTSERLALPAVGAERKTQR